VDWGILWEYRHALAHSFLLTLIISLLSIAGAFAVGTVIACIGTLPGFFPPRIAAAYIEPMRNVPGVIKLFFFYFIVGLEPVAAGVSALVLHHSAYVADILESGFRAVPREQTEAGLATGLGRVQIFRHILVPQAFRISLPPMTSQFVDIVKNSALCMFIGVQELTWQTHEIASDTFRGFEAATAITVLYLLLAMAVVGAMVLLQRSLSYGRAR
jgi:polar amino acid transport system permease protein